MALQIFQTRGKKLVLNIIKALSIKSRRLQQKLAVPTSCNTDIFLR